MAKDVNGGAKDSSRQTLIKQNPRDEVLTLIHTVKEEEKQRKSLLPAAKASAKKREAARMAGDFTGTFYHLCDDYFGLVRSRVDALTDAALKELEKLIARRALSRSLPYRCLAYTPVVGWSWYGLNSLVKAEEKSRGLDHDPKPGKSWSYRYLRGRLRSFYGENWFLETMGRTR